MWTWNSDREKGDVEGLRKGGRDEGLDGRWRASRKIE